MHNTLNRESSYLVSAKGVGDDAFCQLQSNFISVSDVVHTTPCKKKEEILEVYYFGCIYFFVMIGFPLPLISIQKNEKIQYRKNYMQTENMTRTVLSKPAAAILRVTEKCG